MMTTTTSAKKSYKEKLLDPRWQKMRLKVLERDNWTCQGCLSTKKELHVHHIKYPAGDIWNTPMEDMQTLCVDCHKKLGKHPKGGVSWNSDDFVDENGVVVRGVAAFRIHHCPMCGSTNLRDKGSFDKCMDCAERICPPFGNFPGEAGPTNG